MGVINAKLLDQSPRVLQPASQQVRGPVTLDPFNKFYNTFLHYKDINALQVLAVI